MIFGLTNNKNNNKEVFLMEKWVCVVCAYVYDEAIGDPDSGIAAGTKFEKINFEKK